MAQNFKQVKMRNIGTSATDIPDGANFPTGFHTLIGINMANVTANAIKVSVYITNTNNFYIVKDMVIPSGSAYSHEAKINVLAGDRLYFVSDTASSLDVIVSYVQEIST